MWHRLASTASNKNGAKIQNDISRLYQISFFPKYQNKAEFKNLDDSVVIFQLCGLNDLYCLNNLHGLNDLYILISSKKLLIISGTQMTNIGPF